MKIKVAVRRLCDGCYVVRKKNKKIYVYCTKNVRHKQRSPYHTAAFEGVRASSSPFASYLPPLGLPSLEPQPISALLAHRQTSSLGQLYWMAECCSCAQEQEGDDDDVPL